MSHVLQQQEVCVGPAAAQPLHVLPHRPIQGRERVPVAPHYQQWCRQLGYQVPGLGARRACSSSSNNVVLTPPLLN
jgi:hypothetical protein